EYCASKFAMHGWNDSLRCELAAEGIQVTLVSPSTTRSEFFRSLIETDTGTKSKSFGSWSAEQVSKATIRAIIHRKREVILSTGGKLLVYADRLVPGLVNRILKRPRYAKRTNAN
ncbi:MAG: SDR family NAD(P)-dependent oxidoreductase, partial [Rubripirellula sp.]